MREIIEIAGAILAAVIALYLALQKYLLIRAKDTTIIAGESAVALQFQLLHDELKHNRAEAEGSRRETAELRLKFIRMDNTLREQQQAIARMQLMLHQLAGIVKETGTEVPPYMQKELDSLIAPFEAS